MKKSLLLSIILLTLTLCGCTHNDGDIGILFGEWTLTDLQIDGRTDKEALNRGYVWAFQSHVIGIKELMEHNEFTTYWGSWQKEGQKLILDYSHGTKPSVPTAPEGIYMTDTKMEMDIISESKKNLTLSYIDPQGRKIIYTLRKQW